MSIPSTGPFPTGPSEGSGVTPPAQAAGQTASPSVPQPGPHPPEDPALLEARFRAVKERIAAAARRSGRRPESIVLVAVTKFAEPDQIRQLVRLGQRDFGENYVQTLLHHAATLDELGSRGATLPNARSAAAGTGAVLGMPQPPGAPPDRVRWHMIGHLQRNKVKKVVETCRLIHTVDSLRLAEEIQIVAQKREQPVDVLVQVNCSGEEQKFGVPPPAALHLCEQIDTMVGVRVRGLMTMAAYGEDPEAARPAFRRCRELFVDIRRTGIAEGRFDILSMGMSGDFEVAIEEGANVVRVGSAIFGERELEPRSEPGPDEAPTEG